MMSAFENSQKGIFIYFWVKYYMLIKYIKYIVFATFYFAFLILFFF